MIETNGLPLILGSSSIWRQKVLSEIGCEFQAISPEIDEKAIRHQNPRNLVLAIAQAKAEAVLELVDEPAIIITCDQVILCNNELREKPKDQQEAIRFLRSYADFPAVSVTGVCVTQTETMAQDCDIDVARVFFHPMSMELMVKLVENTNIMGCSGAFDHKDELMVPYIRKIEGTSESVSGLPLHLVEKLIQNVL